MRDCVSSATASHLVMDFLGLSQALERLDHLRPLEALVSQVVDDHLAVVRPVVLLHLQRMTSEMPPRDARCYMACSVVAEAVGVCTAYRAMALSATSRLMYVSAA